MKKIDVAKDKSNQKKCNKKPTKTPVSKITPARKIKQKNFLVAFMKNNCMVQASCDEVGINPKTFYDWCKENDFHDQINQCIERRLDAVERNINKLALTDTTAAIFQAKCLLKKRGYIEKQQLEMSGNLDIKILNIDPFDVK